jgi:hypothetical protein
VNTAAATLRRYLQSRKKTAFIVIAAMKAVQ